MVRRLSAIRGLFILRLIPQTAFLFAWLLLSSVCYAQTDAQVQVRVFMEGLIKPIPEMVHVNAGEFAVGIANSTPTAPHNRYWSDGNLVTTQTNNVEWPQQQITLFQPFEVSRFEITREQFKFFLDSSGRASPHSVWDDPRYYAQQADHPAAYVSWNDAQAYVAWLKEETGNQRYRLLSEAEWEYATRAGTTSLYAFGDTITQAQANFDSDGTVSVGSYDANGFGLYDVHGNVWEWVEDCWHPNYNGLPTNGSTWEEPSCDDQVLRGGGWDSDDTSLLRSAQRGTGSKDERFNDVGFRIARTLTPRLTIASPKADTDIVLVHGDTPVSAQVQVVINVDMQSPGTLKLTSDDESVVSVPDDIPIQPVAGSTQTTVMFTLTSQGLGNTIITIAVVDDQGVTNQVKTRVEVWPIYPEMIRVERGIYTMGSPSGEGDDSERPQHDVTVPGFAVGRYEVTRGQFAAFADETSRTPDSSCNWKNPGFTQNNGHPVVCVSWDDAQAYVDWLSTTTDRTYRLLSESEWEYVARAGTQMAYSIPNNGGYGSDTITPEDARYGASATVAAGSYRANAFGLYDVHGNAAEWVEDCWHDDYDTNDDGVVDAPTDGSAWETECQSQTARLTRGGGYSDSADSLRSAARLQLNTTPTDTGFRIARTLPTPQIAMPLQNDRFTLVLENGQPLATVNVPVSINVIEPDSEPITMTLRLDSGGDSVVSTTTLGLVTLPTATDGNTSATFTLNGKGVGMTMLSIVVTDRLGSTTETKIAVETISIPRMTRVAAGTFMMGSAITDRSGSSSERPQHSVNIPGPFEVSIYEITREEFKSFADSSGINTHRQWRNAAFYRQTDFPAGFVSWNSAKQYAQWLSEKTGRTYRLLSESEWEYAARAGTTTTYSFMTNTGYGIDDTRTVSDSDDLVWRGSPPIAVGTYQPNRWGLYDVHGNAQEWVEDCWHGNYNGAPTDGSAWTTSCTNSVGVLRSGSGSIFNIRSASRSSSGGPTEGSIPANDTGGVFGFRIARTLPITIVSPLQNQPYQISSSDGSRTSDTVTVRVSIRVLDEQANVSMAPQSDADGDPIVAPIPPVAFPLTGKEQSAEFTMTASGADGNTVVTIVVTDDAGNSSDINIRVEAFPIPAMTEVPPMTLMDAERFTFMMGARSDEGTIAGNNYRQTTNSDDSAVIRFDRPEFDATLATALGRARPSHSVTIGKSFEVGSYEITNRQFKAYLDDDTDATQGACSSISSGNIALSCATWAQAKAYVVWLSGKTKQNYRLLSESEWEYAARAGTTTAYSTGSDSISDSNANIDMLDPRLSAWGGTNANIQAVGRYSPNAWGLYDVHGNAAEWVQDCWHDDYDLNNDGVADAPTDGSAWEQNCTANTGVSRSGEAANGVIIYQRNRRVGSQTLLQNRRVDGRFQVSSWHRRTSSGQNGFRIARDLP